MVRRDALGAHDDSFCLCCCSERRARSPARDQRGIAHLPGLAAEEAHYLPDVYDHLIRISDLVDSYRERLTSAMDVYPRRSPAASTALMKQLAVIATIFLPLVALAMLLAFFKRRGWI